MLVKVKDKVDKTRMHLKESDFYEVIAVFFIHKENTSYHELKYRILNDEGTVGLYSAINFEVIESKISSDYIFTQNKDSGFSLVPKILSGANFWADFFEGELYAIELFKKRFPQYFE